MNEEQTIKHDDLMLGFFRYQGYALMLQGLVLALMGLGLVMIYSAQGRVDRPPLHEAFFTTPAGKQLVFVGISLLMIIIFSWINYDWFRPGETTLGSVGFWMLLLSVILLIGAYIPGIGMEINGARRWIKFGSFTFQPSEFAKIALMIYLAGKLSQSEFPRKEFLRGLLPLSLVVGLICGIVGKEDLGTAAVIAAVSGLLLVAGGIQLWYLILPAIPAILMFVYLILSEGYRVQRITSFLNPEADPQGSGYHAIQSLLAIAGGGWWGMGLGEGTQKYGYLPEDTTDFIFSIICEELGSVGGMAVLGIFMVFVIVGWLIFRHVKDDFGKLLVFGLMGVIAMQATINIAVATVSVPTKGIALPFVSAGGSGLIFAGMAIGIVCSVNKYSQWNLLKDS